MKYRKFSIALLSTIALFAAANFAVWKLRTEVLLTKVYDGGDLARNGYVWDSKLPRKNQVDLPRRHYPLDFAVPGHGRAEVLTFGDSFSFGLGEGRNHFYQDYIASCWNTTVANVFNYPTADQVMYFSPLTNLIQLYNSGLLDELKPKYVLVESVERYAVMRLSRPYDFSATESREKLVSFLSGKKYNMQYLPPVGFINTGNVKYFYYNLLYRFHDKPFFHRRTHDGYEKLNRPFFSRNGRTLLFVKDDADNVKLVTDQSMALMNDNLNKMAELLEKKGIKLIFMPIVDKYDLYSDYIEHNPYQPNTFFEKLRPLPKKYLFIDTKKLLKEEVDRGVMDVFYPDESHWSYRAPEKIFSTVRPQ